MLKKQPVCFNSGHVASLVFGWIYLYLGSSQSYCHCKCQKRTQWHDAATTMFHCNAHALPAATILLHMVHDVQLKELNFPHQNIPYALKVLNSAWHIPIQLACVFTQWLTSVCTVKLMKHC